MKQPSMEWRERIAPDEAQHMARVARVMAALQEHKSSKYGTGRALHRKQIYAATGVLEVLDGLPDPARHGLFAQPGAHRVLARFSNGGPDMQSNRLPDIRGLALKVLDVAGESALGGAADHQDFLMINQDRTPTTDSREFVDFIEAATPGLLSGILHLFKAYGWTGGRARLRELFATIGKKFNGFAVERFNTVVPLCCGPYAVRVRLRPVSDAAAGARSGDIVTDLNQRLLARSLAWDLELQFFVDEATTPIEDASKAWPDAETPIVTVARLRLYPQGEAAATQAEAAKFDPWSGLAAHRPLGEVMRARKIAYFESQKGRAA